jgi:hypothetical protein
MPLECRPVAETSTAASQQTDRLSNHRESKINPKKSIGREVATKIQRREKYLRWR